MANINREIARFMDISGVRRRFIGELTGPGSYATGGDPLRAGEVNMGVVEFVSFAHASDGAAFRLLRYDHATELVAWVVPDTGAEVGNGTDLSGFRARFEAVGR